MFSLCSEPFCRVYALTLVLAASCLYHVGCCSRQVDKDCGSGHFRCSESKLRCLPQTQWCDGIKDCAGGEDESRMNCIDNYPGFVQSLLDHNLLKSKFTPDNTSEHVVYKEICNVKPELVPPGCLCTVKYRIHCGNSNFTNIPDLKQDSADVTRLYLQGNPLQSLGPGAFDAYPSLELLQLRNTSLQKIDKDAFRQLENLTYLYLEKNSLEELPNGVFRDLGRLMWL